MVVVVVVSLGLDFVVLLPCDLFDAGAVATVVVARLDDDEDVDIEDAVADDGNDGDSEVDDATATAVASEDEDGDCCSRCC